MTSRRMRHRAGLFVNEREFSSSHSFRSFILIRGIFLRTQDVVQTPRHVERASKRPRH